MDEASKFTFFDAVDVEDLTELKIVFDRFSVDQKITPTEACQALTEAGVVTPRRQMAKYLRSRHHVLMDRSIDFYEFIRAYAILRHEQDLGIARPRFLNSSKENLQRGSPVRDKERDKSTSPFKRASLVDESRTQRKFQQLSVGTRVEARYRGRSKYYAGEISRVRLDGTYDIAYDDGEKETKVGIDQIRVLKNSGSRGGGFEEGDKVEAYYRGRSKLYSGRITRVRGDGTYDIDYDDGDQESRVQEELIRPKEGKRSSSPSRRTEKADESESEREGQLSVGTRVEARYRGRSKYYAGEISRVRLDGTYDIAYDDGEKETRVGIDQIRVLKNSGSRGGG